MTEDILVYPEICRHSLVFSPRSFVVLYFTGRFGISLGSILYLWCEVGVEAYIFQCGRIIVPFANKTVLSETRVPNWSIHHKSSDCVGISPFETPVLVPHCLDSRGVLVEVPRCSFPALPLFRMVSALLAPLCGRVNVRIGLSVSTGKLAQTVVGITWML